MTANINAAPSPVCGLAQCWAGAIDALDRARRALQVLERAARQVRPDATPPNAELTPEHLWRLATHVAWQCGEASDRLLADTPAASHLAQLAGHAA